MPFCNHCGEILPPGRISCPTCGQDPQGSSTSTIRDAETLHAKLDGFGAPSSNTEPEPAPPPADGRTRTTENGQEEMIEEFLQTDVSLSEKERRIEYLLRRADEQIGRARTYRALRNKTQSRHAYMRALKYFEEVVALEPDNHRGRQGRQECLTRISS